MWLEVGRCPVDVVLEAHDALLRRSDDHGRRERTPAPRPAPPRFVPSRCDGWSRSRRRGATLSSVPAGARSPVIGRADEIEAVAKAVRAARPCAVSGAPGIGKT